MIHCLSILGLFISGAAPSGSLPQTPETHPQTEIVGTAPGQAGLKVAIDPATGRIIPEPTEADLQVLARSARIERRRSAWDLERFKLDRGGEGVFLDNWAEHSLVVRRDAKGRLHTACAAGDEHGFVPSEAEENLQ